MRFFKLFWRNERGSLTQQIAMFAVFVTIGAVALATFLDRATRDGGAAAIAMLHLSPPTSSRVAGLPENGVDPTPTGSISRPIILDPCTGREK